MGLSRLPSAALLELARAAVGDALQCKEDALELRNLQFGEPVLATIGGNVHVAMFAYGEGQVEFEIYSQDDGGDIVHCQGQGSILSSWQAQTVDLPGIRTQTGLGRRLIELPLPNAQMTQGSEQLVLQQAMLDSALQACSDLVAPGTDLSQPVSIATVRILRKSEGQMLALTSSTEVGIDVQLCDRAERVCVELQGVLYEVGPCASTPLSADEAPAAVRKVSLVSTS
jgi:hypothetical protein